MKNLKHIAAAVIGLCLCSCGENFFDLQPNYQVTVNKIYKTESDFDIAVLGCYAKLQTQMSFYTECCCLLYESPRPRDRQKARIPSSA